MFRQHGQFKMAREFDETAQRYQNEIDARAGGSSLESMDRSRPMTL